MREVFDRTNAVAGDAIWIALVALVALSLFVGCAPEVVGVSGEADDHEAEHYVPPHFPEDAVAAIERLEELLGPESDSAKAPAGAESEVTPRQEVYDLARWLPELAAETELDEPNWNQVRDASRTLERAADDATGDAAPTGADVADAMSALSGIPHAIRDAEASYRRQRGLEDPAELAVDSAETEPSTTGPES